jgi:hypothetical protein
MTAHHFGTMAQSPWVTVDFTELTSITDVTLISPILFSRESRTAYSSLFLHSIRRNPKHSETDKIPHTEVLHAITCNELAGLFVEGNE